LVGDLLQRRPGVDRVVDDDRMAADRNLADELGVADRDAVCRGMPIQSAQAANPRVSSSSVSPMSRPPPHGP
jgi:hypothetical protein